ncbi:hypothetical protein [Agromyces bauzanensis]
MSSPRPRRFVMRRQGAAVAAAGILALALGGCVGTPASTPTPTPSASSEPVFASDEEALAAAEAAYERFIAVSTNVTNDGGANAERLDAVAIGGALKDERAAALRFEEQGIRTAGVIAFTLADLQSVYTNEAGSAVITVYICDDLRGLDLLASDGSSMVAEGRVVDVPYTVELQGANADLLKVSEKELWERDNFCLR